MKVTTTEQMYGKHPRKVRRLLENPPTDLNDTALPASDCQEFTESKRGKPKLNINKCDKK